MPSLFHSTFSRFTHVVAYIRLISSYNWIVFHFMDRANFIYPVIVWWTFGLFSLLGYYESCCYKYLCTDFCVDIMFSILLRIHVEVEVLGQMVILCLTFLAVVTLFFKLAVPFYIPSSSVWGFQLSHNLTNTSFSYCLNYTFIYFFLAVLVLCCCVGFSLVSASRSYSLVAACGLLIGWAFLITEHRL